MIPAEVRKACWPAEPRHLESEAGGHLECHVKGVIRKGSDVTPSEIVNAV